MTALERRIGNASPRRGSIDRRRRRIAAAALLGATGLCLPAGARAQSGAPGQAVRLGAAWDDSQGRHHVGLLEWLGDQLRIVASLEVPTRAHGLAWEADGRLLATARRPGDWLLRWSPENALPPQWQWTEPDRRTTGHTLRDPEASIVYSIEADLSTSRSLVVARDAASLEVLAEYPTGGVDAHMPLLTADGELLVANGGVPTLPEAGRQRGDMDRMDSSLVLLRRPRSGRVAAVEAGERLGQWRLGDRRLSLRHMARHAGRTVGIALQAEHDDPASRQAAPLLALFDGRQLHAVAADRTLAGYGGDIAATVDGFAVSATRAGGVARFSSQGVWLGFEPLTDACALVSDGPGWWAGGVRAVVDHEAAERRELGLPDLRLDNHWVLRRA